MVRLLIALALIGLAYWYWTENQPKSFAASEAARLEENAAVMQRCTNQEEHENHLAAWGSAKAGETLSSLPCG